MKKFREFEVKTHGIKSLEKALVKHAKYLGYKFDNDWDKYTYFRLGKDGGCWFSSPFKDKELTLDEFFALTPEDVIDEPERFNVEFVLYDHHGRIKDTSNIDLTQDQINRICGVMDEASE